MKKTIIISIIILVSLCVVILGYLYFKNSTEIDFILDANVEALNQNLNHTDSLTGKNNDSIIAAKQQALLYNENLSNEITYRYYIITGSFRKKENAERQKILLEEKGFLPKIIRSDFEHYKVSIFSSSYKSVALDSLEKIKSREEFRSAWLLKRRK